MHECFWTGKIISDFLLPAGSVLAFNENVFPEENHSDLFFMNEPHLGYEFFGEIPEEKHSDLFCFDDAHFRYENVS